MPSKFHERRILRCSFCGKFQDQVRKIIAGASVYICDECVELCNDILDGDPNYPQNNDYGMTEEGFKLPKPKEIHAFLNEYVVGQERAKVALSVAVYNHYKRIAMEDGSGKGTSTKGTDSDAQDGNLRDTRARNIGVRDTSVRGVADEEIEIQKSNILLVGPTGSGKTYLAQTLAKMLQVPFAIGDATSLTEAGYVGEDVENILLKLIQAADGDIKKAERGIIYIDEIDKIARHGDNPSITRDVSGEGVQQGLLKILEGTLASVPPQGGRKHPHQDFLQIDTSGILFICGGAFNGIDKVVERRLNKKTIGFGAENKTKKEKILTGEDLMAELNTQDLHKFGFIPEIIGRLPVLVTLSNLDEEALLAILTQPKNALTKQYQYLLELDNVHLEFEEEALRLVAKQAIERETGARGLRAIVEGVMTQIMYDVPSDETVERLIVTQESVEKKIPPKIIYNENRQPIIRKQQKRRRAARSNMTAS